MSRRTPFPFADHLTRDQHETAELDLIDLLIAQYEEALANEYMSGDIDTASYNEGIRTAHEGTLMELLGIERSVMDAYWGRTPRPAPETYDLPHPPSDPLITYEQVVEWSGRRLDRDQWEALNEAIPNSSIPDAIGTIVDSISVQED